MTDYTVRTALALHQYWSIGFAVEGNDQVLQHYSAPMLRRETIFS